MTNLTEFCGEDSTALNALPHYQIKVLCRPLQDTLKSML